MMCSRISFLLGWSRLYSDGGGSTDAVSARAAFCELFFYASLEQKGKKGKGNSRHDIAWEKGPETPLFSEREFRRLWVTSTKPRKRIKCASARTKIWGTFSAKNGVCAAHAAIERHLKRFSRFGGQNTGGFLMARARFFFCLTQQKNGNFCSAYFDLRCCCLSLFSLRATQPWSSMSLLGIS